MYVYYNLHSYKPSLQGNPSFVKTKLPDVACPYIPPDQCTDFTPPSCCERIKDDGDAGVIVKTSMALLVISALTAFL